MEKQPGFTLWLTGMSGAGKSTLARYIASRLPLIGRRVELLDGPEVEALFPEVPRESAREQLEHATRALGWAAKLLTRNGVITVVTSLSPYREARDEVRKAIGRFVEVMVDAPFEKLMERDTRGIYRIDSGITDVIGFHAPYETNTNPEIKVDTGTGQTEEELGRYVFERLFNHGFLSRRERDVLINGGTLVSEEAAEEEVDPEEAREAVIARAELEARAAAAAAAPTGLLLKGPAARAESEVAPAKGEGARAPARAAKPAPKAEKAPAEKAKPEAAATEKSPARAKKAAATATAAKTPKATRAPAPKTARAASVAAKAGKAAAAAKGATAGTAKGKQAPKAAAPKSSGAKATARPAAKKVPAARTVKAAVAARTASKPKAGASSSRASTAKPASRSAARGGSITRKASRR